MNWYEIENIAAVDSPALLIYKEYIQYNIDRAIGLVQSVKQLRPHVKTHKIKEVSQMMQSAGIKQFKCATIAEAEMLAIADAKDVLIAFPIIGPKIERFKALRQKYPNTQFSCLIDNAQSAKQLSDQMEANVLEVYIDLNIGMNRTGILPERALELFKSCQNLSGIKIVGLHAYDGHIYDTNLAQRTERANAGARPIQILVDEIEVVFQQKMQVVVGGTPTFAIHAQQNQEWQVSPGTFVFWDEGYQTKMPDFEFRWAAVLVCRVVSIINQTTLCLDLGHKSIAAENPLPRLKFLNVSDTKQIGQSEEHLVVEVASTEQHQVGDVWYGVPLHVCPTVALYDSVNVVESQRFVASWRVVARDRQITL
jgi:D-threonine aldolase